ncbi:MAG: flavodoxin family protein [Clostridia bacterium]
MKKSIVFSSATGNTELLAKEIQENIGDTVYFGKPSDEALDADVIYIGSFAQAFSCTADIKEFASKISNKKVFLFMTAGYGSTTEFFAPIMASFKENINDTNEIIGEFICQGKVSDSKKNAIKQMDEAKFNTMEPELLKAESHPDANDISNLKASL